MSVLFFSPINKVNVLFFLAKIAGCFTPLSFRTGIVRNPSGRDSNLSEHSPPCEVDPVQSIYRMTAESDETRMLEKGPKKGHPLFPVEKFMVVLFLVNDKCYAK